MQNQFRAVLPAWGPYSKKYMGISHVPDTRSLVGARFDCVVFPTIANSGVPVPNVTVPSGYHPWNARSDLSFMEYRYELEWKDKVYADVSFSRLSENAVLIRTAFVNRSELPQNCVLNYFCALEYPSPVYCSFHLPANHQIWSATEYTKYRYANPRPWDGQNPDGARKGEFRDPLFTGGFGLGDRVDASHVPQLKFLPFGAKRGDTVEYAVKPERTMKNAVLGIRYRTKSAGNGGRCSFAAAGLINREITFAQTDELAVVYTPVGTLSPEPLKLCLTALGSGCGVELDCLFLVEGGSENEVSFRVLHRNCVPAVEQKNGTAFYRYENMEGVYGLQPLADRVRYRSIESGSLEDAVISRLSNADETFDDVTEPFTRSFHRKHTNEGFYHNTVVSHIFIESRSTHMEYAVVFKDDLVKLTKDECERIYQSRKEPETLGLTQEGKPYEFSNRLLKSTLLSNVVYPIYKHGVNIKHFTPGKRWDSLYTWDSGFIGLGLLETQPLLAEYILDTYLAETDNPDYAFLFHGSPVPVQIYLYLELLNRQNDKTGLLRYYKRARLFYLFLTGKTHGSTAARFKSGLTSTYDLFYSTSGMDDYPAQVYIHQNGLERNVTPCISASHAIRFGKILKMIADESGFTEDSAEYAADIARMTRGLDRYAWDAESGYFSYVVYNSEWEAEGILRTESGENYNKGFDGLYPLIAGACTGDQTRALLGHIGSPNEIFSSVGLSAVDMTSGYYRDNGYWNGSVWFSHQWFFYKAMLDLGETDLAYRIADTALHAWKREVDDSYNCFEMMNIATGRGGWYHQFGGLSAPVSIWANAYFRRGTITSGFDLWIVSRDFAADYRSCSIRFDYHGNNPRFALIIVMDDDPRTLYQAALDGAPIPFQERCKGVLEIKIDGEHRAGNLIIQVARLDEGHMVFEPSDSCIRRPARVCTNG